jgi:hypothetical protein
LSVKVSNSGDALASQIGVFKNTDGAETWVQISSGLGDLNIVGLEMDPDFPSILYAATFSSENIDCGTVDSGLRWG